MKKISIVLSSILIIAICIPIISYAFDMSTDTTNDNKAFFEVEKMTASPGETLNMNLNLDEIQYENYQFSLTSNISLENITTQENIETEVKADQLIIEGNKTELNVSKITLSYEIPEDIEIGTIIQLTATIQEKVDNVINNTENEETENEVEDNTINSEQITIYITIIEDTNETENTETNNGDSNIENSNENMEFNKDGLTGEQNTQEQNGMQTLNNTTQNMTQKTQTSLVQTSGTISVSQSSNTDTYNGESDNYLSTLSVDGYTFSSEFSKTNTTYFINVENDVTSINVYAEAEDENAKVSIYGNENLQEGENKILISVTAENGDVKTYRIYVTKEA